MKNLHRYETFKLVLKRLQISATIFQLPCRRKNIWKEKPSNHYSAAETIILRIFEIVYHNKKFTRLLSLETWKNLFIGTQTFDNCLIFRTNCIKILIFYNKYWNLVSVMKLNGNRITMNESDVLQIFLNRNCSRLDSFKRVPYFSLKYIREMQWNYNISRVLL